MQSYYEIGKGIGASNPQSNKSNYQRYQGHGSGQEYKDDANTVLPNLKCWVERWFTFRGHRVASNSGCKPWEWLTNTEDRLAKCSSTPLTKLLLQQTGLALQFPAVPTLTWRCNSYVRCGRDMSFVTPRSPGSEARSRSGKKSQGNKSDKSGEHFGEVKELCVSRKNDSEVDALIDGLARPIELDSKSQIKWTTIYLERGLCREDPVLPWFAVAKRKPEKLRFW